MIDSRAVISPQAQIAANVEIGPFTVIGADVVIGAGTWIGPHAVINGPTRIGADNKIFQFASLGDAPQDKKYKGEPTRLEIGDRNVFRESVTVNRGTTHDQGVTRIGNDNLLMAYSHVAHDCQLGNQIVMANCATLGGHVEVGDWVIMGGLSAVHQFTRIGQQAMIGGVCGVRGDVIPYGLVNGQYARLEGLNIVGMKRRKFTRERLAAVRSFYQKLFESAGVFSERLDAARALAVTDPAVAEILTFIDAGQHRPLCLPSSRTGENG